LYFSPRSEVACLSRCFRRSIQSFKGENDKVTAGAIRIEPICLDSTFDWNEHPQCNLRFDRVTVAAENSLVPRSAYRLSSKEESRLNSCKLQNRTFVCLFPLIAKSNGETQTTSGSYDSNAISVISKAAPFRLRNPKPFGGK